MNFQATKTKFLGRLIEYFVKNVEGFGSLTLLQRLHWNYATPQVF